MADSDDERPIGVTNTLIQKQRQPMNWLWEGVLADGAVTLLSAPEKTGKTTLLSLLLDRRRAGGALLGRTVYPGKTILCSEESHQLWSQRQPPLNFGPDLLFHRPTFGAPSRGRWKRFINDVCELTSNDEAFDLLVIDTAVSFIPLAPRNPRVMRWALSELRLIADFSGAVLLLNQSRNMHRPLAAFADIVIDMTIPRGAPSPRRRLFTGVGRYPDTLPSAHAELSADATDYLLLPDTLAPHPPLLSLLQALLRASATPLTRQELLARWPSPAPRPDTLWRTLARGVERGLFTISGSGTKVDAYRYGVAAAGDAGGASV